MIKAITGGIMPLINRANKDGPMKALKGSCFFPMAMLNPIQRKAEDIAAGKATVVNCPPPAYINKGEL